MVKIEAIVSLGIKFKIALCLDRVAPAIYDFDSCLAAYLSEKRVKMIASRVALTMALLFVFGFFVVLGYIIGPKAAFIIFIFGGMLGAMTELYFKKRDAMKAEQVEQYEKKAAE